jgi:hypothetical protein
MPTGVYEGDDSLGTLIRTVVDELFNRGQLAYCVPTTGVLVETLIGVRHRA